jgi:hypothetical protein
MVGISKKIEEVEIKDKKNWWNLIMII